MRLLRLLCVPLLALPLCAPHGCAAEAPRPPSPSSPLTPPTPTLSRVAPSLSPPPSPLPAPPPPRPDARVAAATRSVQQPHVVPPPPPLPPPPALVPEAAALLSGNTCAPSATNALTGLPDVQCWRQPAPCVHADYITLPRCRAWRADADWPTADGVLSRPAPGEAPWTSMAELTRRLFAHKTVVFMGDSINTQLVAGLTCEAERTGLALQRAEDGPEAAAAAARHEARVKAAEAAGESNGTAPWRPGSPIFEAFAPETNTTFVCKGWGHFYADDFRALLRVADVLVVNFGLHYSRSGRHNFSAYAADMAAAVAAMDAWAAQGGGRVALFRETSAQTFKRTGAFVTHAAAAVAGVAGAWWDYPCAAMTADMAAHNAVATRNAIVDAALSRAVHVRRLPFYNLTAAHAAQYVGRRCQFSRAVPRCRTVRASLNETELAAAARCQREREATPFVPCADCTHLCWTPLLYARLAHDLAAACEEAAARSAARARAGGSSSDAALVGA
jgi:hypothetical protein